LADYSSTDIAVWQSAVVSDLKDSRNSDGGWGYFSGQDSATEPTSLALLALSVLEPNGDSPAAAEAWLISYQRQDGFFPAWPAHPEISWITPLGGLALYQRSRTSAVQAAAVALLSEQVYTFPSLLPNLYGYDTQIPGWPWTSGDFSFVEPTSLAIIFLKQAGYWNEQRVRQGVQLLNDRALAAGGWNYGEPQVLEGDLYPAVLSTAMALLALADEPNDKTSAALDWLQKQSGQISSLLSLGWATMALNVYGMLNDDWRARVITRWNELPQNRRGPMEASLCLLGLADVSNHPFGLI
jgi:hypothetical protein